ncbi:MULTISPECIES: hypothetical protein [Bradyrhizobium]|jgi:hypothetical protein|nr:MULTISPECIES: hypothetical protein [Bradyrhizobium]
MTGRGGALDFLAPCRGPKSGDVEVQYFDLNELEVELELKIG